MAVHLQSNDTSHDSTAFDALCSMKHRCVVDKHGEYELDDWLHFAETFSDLVVPDELLDPRFLAMPRCIMQSTAPANVITKSCQRFANFR
jgi:hypothetical protein